MAEGEGENGRSNISSRRRVVRRFVNHNNMGEGKRSLTLGKGLPIHDVQVMAPNFCEYQVSQVLLHLGVCCFKITV